jgi:hypothetical protein
MPKKFNETSVTSYKLKAFSNSKEPDFAKAIKLYLNNIDITSLTNTNEITFCVDNYNQKFKGSDFVVAGLYQNTELIGYCQFIYISEERLIIIDYIVIDEMYRGLNSFQFFVEKIREIVQARDYEIQYLVCEINIQSASSERIPRRTQSLIKLLKSNNFGEIRTSYFQPMLGKDNFESEQKSILMIYPANQYETIKRETFIKLIEAIYFKHYERWYSLFLPEDEMIKYSKHLHRVFNMVSEKVASAKLVDIERDEDLYGSQSLYDKGKISNSKKGVLLIVGFIGLLILLFTSSIVLKKIYGIEIKDQFYILFTTAVIYLIILSVFSRKAASILNNLIAKIIEKAT